MNVHPSLLPRWRGAAPVERAILAGDERDRGDDPPDGRRARRRARRGAGGVRSGPTSTRVASTRARARSLRGSSPTCSPIPCSRPRPRRERATRRRSRLPTASSTSPTRSTPGGACGRCRRISARGRCSTAGASPSGRRGSRTAARAGGRPARRPAADGVRRVPARRPMIAPARRAAFEVVRRTFDDDAYTDRALASAVATLDARDRALAQRLAFGTVQRVRVLDVGIEQIGRRPVRKLDRPVKASLRLGALPARVHGAAAARDRRRRGRARPRRRPRAGGAVHERRHAPARARASRPGRIAAAAGRVKESYPDWIADVWTRDLGKETALELMHAQNEPPALGVRSPVPVGEPTDVPGAYAVERVDRLRRHAARMSRASQLAALVVGAREGERVLDACAAPGGKSWILGEVAQVTAVEIHPGRAAALAKQELPGRRGGQRRRARARALRASTARSSTRRAPGSGCWHGGPTCAGARSRCPSCSRSCSRPRPRG